MSSRCPCQLSAAGPRADSDWLAFFRKLLTGRCKSSVVRKSLALGGLWRRASASSVVSDVV